MKRRLTGLTQKEESLLGPEDGVYTKEEWKPVAKYLYPGITREEYDNMWQSFSDMKAVHIKQTQIHLVKGAS